MLEYAPIVVGAMALIPAITGKKNDRAKIEQAFKNIGFGVKENGNPKYPFFMKKHEGDFITRYDYKLPLGLVVPDKLQKVLATTLNKPVEITGDNVISIFVSKRNLPTKWDYREVPSIEGDKWVVPIGLSYKGMVWHNFDETPHMTIAGTTRFGKTVLLKNMMTYLIEHHPDDVSFYIIDLKRRLEFNPYRDLKQVKEIAGTPREAAEMLKHILSEVDKTADEYLEKKQNNILKTGNPKRTFIIIDEGAKFMPKKGADKKTKEMLHFCMEAISEIAAISGGLGYRQIYATQYPTVDSLPKNVKMNSDAKISFRLPTGYASEVAIDEYGAEKLECAGRAIYKTHDRVTVQVPLLEDINMEKRLGRYEIDKAHATPGEGESNLVRLRKLGGSDESALAEDE